MSITELTTASAWIVGLAIVALVAAGWRKPARATTTSARATRSSRRRGPIDLAETSVGLHRPTPVWRRLWAIVASSGIAVVIGALIAIVVAFGVAFTVTTLTDMLRQ